MSIKKERKICQRNDCGKRVNRPSSKFCSHSCSTIVQRSKYTDKKTHRDYTIIRLDKNDPFYNMTWVSGWVYEHRVVLARKIGRPLLPTESVHHINGDKKDNSESNLQLRSGSHGPGVHLTCNSCGSHDVRHEKI